MKKRPSRQSIKSFVGVNLKAWRKSYNFSLDDISLDTGISKAYLSQLESGKSKPSAEIAYILWTRTAIRKDHPFEMFCFNPLSFA
jgi:DNA-binding transcriptional regulator YiaG